MGCECYSTNVVCELNDVSHTVPGDGETFTSISVIGTHLNGTANAPMVCF